MQKHDTLDNPNQEYKTGQVCKKTAIYSQYNGIKGDFLGSEFDKEVKEGDSFPPSGPNRSTPADITMQEYFHFKERLTDQEEFIATAHLKWAKMARKFEKVRKKKESLNKAIKSLKKALKK